MLVGLSGTLLGCAGILVVEVGRFRGVGRGVITTNFWIQLTTHGSPPGSSELTRHQPRRWLHLRQRALSSPWNPSPPIQSTTFQVGAPSPCTAGRRAW